MSAPDEHAGRVRHLTRPDRTTAVLILGGTAEARELANRLVVRGHRVITSLAGRVRDPALPVGEVRIGGFSTTERDGVAGLAHYLAAQRITAIVDATHPFAATISANAAAASRLAGTPLLRLQRPGWRAHPDAGRWIWVDSVQQAVVAGGTCQRPFLTTGRQSLETFLDWADREVTVRVVDPPTFALPDRWRLVRSRGPYAYADERALMVDQRSDLLVTKDSGGAHTAAKLDVARDLGVEVVIIARPAAGEDIAQVAATDDVLAWLG